MQKQLARQKLSRVLDHADETIKAALAARRDSREPGRERKEKRERSLAAILRRHFNIQRAALQQALLSIPPVKKTASKDTQSYDYEQFMVDDELEQNIYHVLLDAVQDGVLLTADSISIGLDYSLVNEGAARWARRYAGELVKQIDGTTLRVLRSAIADFVATPEMTIQDVMDRLPFDSSRAMMVAVTEITRSYAEATIKTGKALRRQYPDVKVIKRWFTNEDSLVCDLCRENEDAGEVNIDEPFPSGDDAPPAHPGDRCWIESSTRMVD